MSELPEVQSLIPVFNPNGWGPVEPSLDTVIEPLIDMPFRMYSKDDAIKGVVNWGNFDLYSKKGGERLNAAEKNDFKLVGIAKQPKKTQQRRGAGQYVKKERLTEKEWFEQQYGHLPTKVQMLIKKQHDLKPKQFKK